MLLNIINFSDFFKFLFYNDPWILKSRATEDVLSMGEGLSKFGAKDFEAST